MSLTINATGSNASRNDPISCTLSASVSAGAILVILESNGPLAGLTVSDSVNSGTYEVVENIFVSGIGSVALAMIEPNATGTPVIEATNTSSSGMGIAALNVVGFAQTPTVDSSAYLTGTGSGTAVSETPASNFNNEILFCGMNDGSFVSGTPSGWTGIGGIAWYKILATPASAPFNATLGSSTGWLYLNVGTYDGSAAVRVPSGLSLLGCG